MQDDVSRLVGIDQMAVIAVLELGRQLEIEVESTQEVACCRWCARHKATEISVRAACPAHSGDMSANTFGIIFMSFLGAVIFSFLPKQRATLSLVFSPRAWRLARPSPTQPAPV